MFRFNDKIRSHVKAIADAMEYANSRDDGRWAWQSSEPTCNGVYGALHTAIEHIVRMECGDKVLNYIECSRHGWNYGGNGCFFEDIEVAIDEAINELTINPFLRDVKQDDENS